MEELHLGPVDINFMYCNKLFNLCNLIYLETTSHSIHEMMPSGECFVECLCRLSDVHKTS